MQTFTRVYPDGTRGTYAAAPAALYMGVDSVETIEGEE